MTEPTFDHEKLDVYRVSIDYFAFSYGIVVQRTERSVDAAIEYEYEYEYRDAEYEEEARAKPEQTVAGKRQSIPGVKRDQGSERFIA